MKIICVTGTRADYGIYRPLLFEMEQDPHISLQLAVTGMHVLPEYGRTLDEIARDPFAVVSAHPVLFKGDSTCAMSQSLAVALLYFADLFQFHRPQFVLLLGDRGEMLAAAIAAHYQNIGIVHLHGGEISGSADDAVRHCISQLAHLHFVSCRKAEETLLRFGVEAWRITPVGSLRKADIRRVGNWPAEKRRKTADKYGLDRSRKNVIFAMHPDSKDPLSFERQIGEPLSALSAFPDLRLIFIGPNSDAGGEVFRRKIRDFVSSHPRADLISSLPPDEYLLLLSVADLMVGNSSSGIIEAPFFRLPFVNIGARQKNREHGDNVLSVPCRHSDIRGAIRKGLALPRDSFRRNPYDLTEHPEKKLLETMKRQARRSDLLMKKMADAANNRSDRS